MTSETGVGFYTTARARVKWNTLGGYWLAMCNGCSMWYPGASAGEAGDAARHHLRSVTGHLRPFPWAVTDITHGETVPGQPSYQPFTMDVEFTEVDAALLALVCYGADSPEYRFWADPDAVEALQDDDFVEVPRP